MVATKVVPPGTVIFRELPAVVFPNLASNSLWMVCRGCCREIGVFGVAPFVQCSDCGLPLCKSECDFDGTHRDECELLQRASYKFSKREVGSLNVAAFTGLAILRILRWAEKYPVTAKTLYKLAPRSHGMKQELNDAMWSSSRDWVVEKLGLDISEEKLKQAFRVANLATVNLPTSNAPKMGPFKIMGAMVVYAGRSMVSHGCITNVYFTRLEEDVMETVLVSSRELKAGEVLVMDHNARWFKSADYRRTWASEHGVPCPLCADPATLGLHLDSWTCTRKGCRGLVVPLRGADSPDEGGRCQSCGLGMSAEEMESAAWEARRALEALEEAGSLMKASTGERKGAPSLRQWERFLHRYERPRGPLHPMHWIALRAKKELIFTVAGCLGNMNRDHNTEELVRWEGAFRDVLRALDVLAPGYNNMRTNINMQLVKLLCIRLMHLHKDGLRGRKLQVLYDEATSVLKDIKKLPRTVELQEEYAAMEFICETVTTLL
ncbi:SET domain-containing protein SmydA-8-like [Frankliniella occidentalis]|uniref:SET domain-containing protein SmydA-8-like n=1 Tax=Frankliniella occidentalis TaxID=133901 RepID=A0A9C6XSF4_FRAOC|nr:SET domain-containing protein SmydA-8-like [Frankliniella occidentalis]